MLLTIPASLYSNNFAHINKLKIRLSHELSLSDLFVLNATYRHIADTLIINYAETRTVLSKMMKPLHHFFDNKVRIVLKNKNIVKGLHKSTDHANKTITLIEVEAWGSEEGADHTTVATNTKFDEKTYDLADIIEIEFEGSHFKNEEQKKYNKDDFFDNLGTSCNQINQHNRYREKDRDNDRRDNYGRNERNYDRRDNNYERRGNQDRRE